MDEKKQECYINRELSWLRFNERVLDEFYSVRVGTLLDQQFISKYKRDDKTRLTATEQIDKVIALTRELRDKKELFYERMVPAIPADINESESMIKQIEEKDRFLHFPYQSIKPYLQLLNEAAHKPEVDSIKITLYRVARNSRIVESLIEAAENGKEVVVLVELRARFDEENNLTWSRRLEEAGCRVIYGLDNLKVHSKLCVITYHEGEQIKYITQVGLQ